MEGTWQVEIRDLAEQQRKEFRLAVLNYEAAPPTKDSSVAISSSPSGVSPTSSSTLLSGSQQQPAARAGWFQRQQKPKASADAASPQKKSMAESFSVYDSAHTYGATLLAHPFGAGIWARSSRSCLTSGWSHRTSISS